MSISWLTWIVKFAPYFDKLDDIQEGIETALASKDATILVQYDAWTAGLRPIVEVLSGVTGLSFADDAEAEAHVLAVRDRPFLDRLKKLWNDVGGSEIGRALIEAWLKKQLGGLV